MATKTIYPTQDARTVTTPSDLGAGACEHLPVGTYSGYDYHSHLGFTGVSWAGIPSSGSITSAVLYLRTTSYHTALSTNTIRVRKMNSSFTEGTASHPMSASNAITGANRGTYSSTGAATFSGGTSTNTTRSVNITTIVANEYGNSSFYLALTADSGVCEFFSTESAYDPYIIITYNPNSAPNAPTLVSPTGGTTITDTTPEFSFTHSDPDSDACASWDLQVDATTDNNIAPDWTTCAIDLSDQVTGISGNDITYTPGSPLAAGWYAWRARTADATNGDGAWSSPAWFKVHDTVTVTITDPGTTGGTNIGRHYYDAGSNTTPHFQTTWTFSCPEGHAQDTATIVIKSSDGLTTLHTHNHTGTSTTAQVSGWAPSNNTSYKVDVTATCTGGASGSVTGRDWKSRWGRVAYKQATTGATTFKNAAPVITEPANSDVVVEYGSSPTGTEPGTWYATAPEAGADDYMHYRVTLLGWGAVSPTSPSLDAITLNWTTVVATPDFWTLGTGGSIDTGQFVYGTQCLKVTATNGAAREMYQDITGLQQNTTYTFSVYAKTVGNARPYIAIRPTGGGTDYIKFDSSTYTASTGEWVRMSVEWYSGSSTSCRVVAATDTTATTDAYVWIDATQFEASTVVTPWKPGFVGGALSIDAGGVQIDAANGGVLRLGGAVDGEVSIGDNGLDFTITDDTDDAIRVFGPSDTDPATSVEAGRISFGGGLAAVDTNLYRSAADTLKTDDSLEVAGSVTVTGKIKGIDPVARVYTNSGSPHTWTKPSNLTHVIVEVVGGGGAGGGANDTAAGEHSQGSGGGSGSYSRKLILAAALGGTETVTVGAGGTGVSAGTGNSGGNSSFGTHCTANGGTGGNASGAAASTFGTSGGAGGSAGTGDIALPGQPGAPGFGSGALTTSGNGGNSQLGGGAVGIHYVSTDQSANGNAATGYGGGGSGAAAVGAVGTARTGGAGAQGVVIVTEFYAS